MSDFYTKLGKFDCSGVAAGGGHAVAVVERDGVAIPPRCRRATIDWAQVAELQAWSQALRAKFADLDGKEKVTG